MWVALAQAVNSVPTPLPLALCGGVEAGAEACLGLAWIPYHPEGLGAAASAAGNASSPQWLAYDYEEVTRPVSAASLANEREVSVAVRLLVSEIGAERLVGSDNGFFEALAILQTVRNRLDPEASNPDGVEGHQGFPGCGVSGDFRSCADPQEYLGLQTSRALTPADRYPAVLLRQATDIAALAWIVDQQGWVQDFTGGSTSFVHLCGGAAYGRSTWYCDGHADNGVEDLPGADPHVGPALFWRPTEIAPGGHYQMERTILIDYLPEGKRLVQQASLGWRWDGDGLTAGD